MRIKGIMRVGMGSLQRTLALSATTGRITNVTQITDPKGNRTNYCLERPEPHVRETGDRDQREQSDFFVGVRSRYTLGERRGGGADNAGGCESSPLRSIDLMLR